MTTKTKKPITKKVVKRPESIVNNAPRTFTEADFPPGTASRQGDIYLIRINALPKSAKSRAARQVAEGNTQGSRHIVTVGDVYNCNPEEVLGQISSAAPKVRGTLQARYIGPVFTTVADMASLEHPEHGHQHWQGAMVIACVVQRNLDAEDREQAARD